MAEGSAVRPGDFVFTLLQEVECGCPYRVVIHAHQVVGVVNGEVQVCTREGMVSGLKGFGEVYRTLEEAMAVQAEMYRRQREQSVWSKKP